MKRKSTFAKFTALALLMATLTIYTASRMGGAAANATPRTVAQADTLPSTELSFGGVNLGRGQTASIIAILKPDLTGRDEGPVKVEFMFHDWDGNLLASETKTISPGHASSLDIRAGTSVLGRSELSPCVKVSSGPSDPTANRIVATLEVWDTATGRALFVLNNPTKSTHNYFAASGDGVVRFGQNN